MGATGGFEVGRVEKSTSAQRCTRRRLSGAAAKNASIWPRAIGDLRPTKFYGKV